MKIELPIPIPAMFGSGTLSLRRGATTAGTLAPWRVLPGKPCTNLVTHTMFLPSSPDPVTRDRARIHELLHARHTPRMPLDAAMRAVHIKDMLALQVGEDMRLHSIAVNAGILDMLTIPLAPQHVLDAVAAGLGMWTRGEWYQAICWHLAHWGLAESEFLLGSDARVLSVAACVTLPPTPIEYLAAYPEEVRPLLREALTSVTTAARKACLKHNYDFRYWHTNITKKIDALLPTMATIADQLARTGTMVARFRRGGLSPAEKLAGEDVGKGFEEGIRNGCLAVLGGSAGQWGTMVVDSQLRHAVRYRPTLRVGKEARSYATEGYNLAAPWRDAIDDRCFRVPRQRAGGTLLVDVSGSMQFEDGAVGEILNQLPAATVAVYSGNDDAGGLTVLASRGRVAPDVSEALHQHKTTHGGGNVVDGPALRWLAQQARPRLWICDGHVTGCGDNSAANLRAEAAMLVASHDIVRLGNVKMAHACATHIQRHGTLAGFVRK